MCLILVGYQPDSDRPLVVAANRDEFHQRASAAAEFWPQYPELLAGKDLVAGGTWLGCTRSGKFAGLTNFNQGGEAPTARSRGSLVHDFLVGDISALNTPRGYRVTNTLATTYFYSTAANWFIPLTLK